MNSASTETSIPRNDHEELITAAEKTIEIAINKAGQVNSAYDDQQQDWFRAAASFCRETPIEAPQRLMRARAAKSLVYILGDTTPPDIVELAVEYLVDRDKAFKALYAQIQSHIENIVVEGSTIQDLIPLLRRFSKYSDFEKKVDTEALKSIILILKDKTPPEIITQGSALAMDAVMRGVETDLDREVLAVIGTFKA